jgi:predicted RNase H-like HicB family nuclease
MTNQVRELSGAYRIQAEELADRSYLVTVSEEIVNGKKYIIAENPELDGCAAHGENYEQAFSNLRAARIAYIESLLEDKLPVPASAPEDATGSVSPQAEPIVINYESATETEVNSMAGNEDRRHELFSYRTLNPAEA